MGPRRGSRRRRARG
uniref:Uncharacterized protein n=1 Tax=Arundo donax TaxID=35708 RepID=A0A0A9BI33_ARUDO